MKMKHIVWTCLVMMTMLPAGAAFAADTLVQLDGQSVEGKSVTAISEGRIEYGGKAFDLMALRKIVRGDVAEQINTDAKSRVTLRDGSLIRVNTLAAAEQFCTIGWAYGEGLRIGLDKVHAILLQAPAHSRDDASKLRQEYVAALDRKVNEDTLLVINDDQLMSIGGVLAFINDQKVGFMYHGQERTIDRAKVYGVVMGGAAPATQLEGSGLVALCDGSRLWGRLVNLNKDVLTLRRGESQTIEVPWSSVREVTIRSDRMSWLCDLEPEFVDDTPLFVLGGWERDRSWLGTPLTLGGKVYEHGLGVHAPCRLVYQSGGRFDVFAAMIGIDDDTHNQNGDCVYQVLADGRKIFEQRMTCKDKPHPVRLDITGVDRVTLQVDYGENLDIGDHADWADARFIRRAEKQP